MLYLISHLLSYIYYLIYGIPVGDTALLPIDSRNLIPLFLAVITASLTAAALPVTVIITSLEWLVPIDGVIYFITFTSALLTAVSAITSPIAAGEPHIKPNALSTGASKALLSAKPALAEYANSRCPASLM